MAPNVLFIVIDDLNSWIGALGTNPDVRTPNIDALAGRGTLFTNAYCNAPYCNASRMSMFTGRRPSTLRIYRDEPLWDRPRRPLTFIERLRHAGYHSCGAGKVMHGTFDYSTPADADAPAATWREIENRPFLWDQFRPNRADPLPPERPLNRMFDFSDMAAVPPEYRFFDWGPLPDERAGHMPDATVVSTLAGFLSSRPPEPFFCAAGLYKPHLPWHVPARYFDLYDRDTLSLPLVKDDDLDDVPPRARKWALTPPDHELVTRHQQWRPAVHAYLAAISYCDEMVGRLIDALDASDLAERTAVVLCSDNGFHLGEKLHWRKFALWEEATRVPLIVTLPGRPAAQRVYRPVGLLDVFPTVLELCGVAPDRDCEGSSLLPLMDGHDVAGHPPPVSTWRRGNHSVRTAEWRYTRYRGGGSELYDHRVDRYEWTNLAGRAELSDVVEKLAALLPSSG